MKLRLFVLGVASIYEGLVMILSLGTCTCTPKGELMFGVFGDWFDRPMREQ